MQLGVNHKSNTEYHADSTCYSSSALKLILKSKQEFYKRYILGEKEEPRNVGALNMGTCLHLKILEPHLYDNEVAVYQGAMRRGKEWELFAAVNKGKTIITRSESDKVESMYNSYLDNPTAVELLQGCEFEHTLVAEYEGIRLKVRCDGINVERGYILDVKSTAYSSDTATFKETVANLGYDLSGYLYAKVASMVYDKKFDFYFVVCSKNDNLCRVFKMSKDTMNQGKLQFSSSIDTLKECLLTGNWDEDSIELELNNELIEEV